MEINDAQRIPERHIRKDTANLFVSRLDFFLLLEKCFRAASHAECSAGSLQSNISAIQARTNLGLRLQKQSKVIASLSSIATRLYIHSESVALMPIPGVKPYFFCPKMFDKFLDHAQPGSIPRLETSILSISIWKGRAIGTAGDCGSYGLKWFGIVKTDKALTRLYVTEFIQFLSSSSKLTIVVIFMLFACAVVQDPFFRFSLLHASGHRSAWIERSFGEGQMRQDKMFLNATQVFLGNWWPVLKRCHYRQFEKVLDSIRVVEKTWKDKSISLKS